LKRFLGVLEITKQYKSKVIMSAMLSQAQRERLFENMRTASSCARRRNLTKQNCWRNRRMLIERAYRRYTSDAPTDVWRAGRPNAHLSRFRDTDSQAEEEDEEEDDGRDSVTEENEDEDEEDDVKDIDTDSDTD